MEYGKYIIVEMANIEMAIIFDNMISHADLCRSFHLDSIVSAGFFAVGAKTREEASNLFLSNKLIEVPSAGSGSFQEVITDLGFDEARVIDWTSSAGDWCFGAKNEHGWFIVSQENRYPYYGFKYMVSDEIGGVDTFENLCDLAQ